MAIVLIAIRFVLFAVTVAISGHDTPHLKQQARLVYDDW